jgi:hypothetical protein
LGGVLPFLAFDYGLTKRGSVNERVSEFGSQYRPKQLDDVGYIKTYWLDPHKEKLVKACVDQHTHFGNVATSRVESIHALLKSHLKKSTLDLFEPWRTMKHTLPTNSQN